MDYLVNHLQVFFSILVVLAAAMVALACDLLKSNNDHLREVNRELRARVQAGMFAAPHYAGSPSAMAALPAPPIAMRVQADRMPQSVARESLERGVRVSSRRPIEDDAPMEQEAGASLAEARLLAREFLGRSADRARGQRTAAPEQMVRESNSDEVREPQVILEETPSGDSISRKDWNQLLTKTRHHSEPRTVEVVAEPSTGEEAPKQRMAELIPFESIQNQSNDLVVPAGFHEGMMLARILNGEKSIRGLVLVIGINDLAVRRNKGELGSEALVASVGEHIKSLLKPDDFACQSSADEFLMICPNEHEGAAQRRLSDIAENLWDFQLQTVGTSSILFSWGGFEAKGEPFADALSAAADRMHETRRSRRPSTGSTSLRRKAV